MLSILLYYMILTLCPLVLIYYAYKRSKLSDLDLLASPPGRLPILGNAVMLQVSHDSKYNTIQSM